MTGSTSGPVRRIISGGQTGVDRAALDVAIDMGVDHGGWCPRGRLAEDGVIPAIYQLRETAAADYPVRTEQNVLDSDGTLILFRGRLNGGTQLTYLLTQRHQKPHLLVDLQTPPPPAEICQWIRGHGIEVLNVAGPRESSAPGIAEQVAAYLRSVLLEEA